MRLKTRMLLSASVAMAVVIILTSIQLWTTNEASKAREQRNTAINLLERISDLNSLNTQYLLYHSERALLQTKDNAESVMSLLSDMKSNVPEEQVILEKISAEVGEIHAVLNVTTILHERQKAGEEVANYLNLNEALTSPILLRAESIGLYAKQLSDVYGNKVATTQGISTILAITTLLSVVAVVTLLLLILWTHILNPILKLKQATNMVAAGNLDCKIDITRNDEIGDVASSFNRMTTELKQTTAALQTQRDTLEIHVQERTKELMKTAQILLNEISEHKQAEAEIHNLNTTLETRVLERTSQLEAINKELDAFTYSVSHDLRAPLRGIDGWSLALLEDYKDKLDKQGQQYLDRVRSEAQHMGQLIDDLLAFSRQSRQEMDLQQIDMTAMAQAIVSHLQQQNPALQADSVIQPGLTAQGDVSLIEIALNNLLSNALKFSSGRSPAIIEFGKIEKDGNRAFFVRDNGVGFDMAYAHKLFGVFQRLHKSSEFPGTGIGLAIVQHIINRHQGRIWAEAQVNGGATFYFTLKEAA